MMPAAVLSVIVEAQGVGPTNAKLNSVQSTLRKTAVAGDTAGTSVARAGAKMEKAGAGMTRVGKAATKYYAAPLLAAAGAALYFGQKYEKSMLMVQTHTDTNRRNLALYKREILEMGRSGKYTQGPSELGEAMYHIASDGYKGVAATKMLRKSADLAMVGQSDLAESTYALVSAMKTGIRGTETSGQAINTLNAIVGAGDMKMQELVGAMSTGVLPAAKAMGLSLKDVGVAEDIMTQRGVPAQQSAYRLAMTFQMLIPHTEKAEAAFERLGLKNKALVKQFEEHPKEGLISAFELLEEHLKKVEGPKGVDQIQTIEEIFGGGRTSRGAITLLQNLDAVRETYGRINQLAGETPKKIAQAKAAPVNRLREAWIQVETVLTELGSDLIPMVAEGITWLAHGVENLAHWFHSLPAGTQATIIKLLALSIAIAFLIRIIGFFVKSFGIMLGWFAKTEVETEAVIATQEALSAAYGETAIAAEASAAAQTAAIEEVAAAQKLAQAEQIMGMPIGGFRMGTMDQLMPYAEDGAQMSLFGASSKAAMATEASTAAEEAGVAAAPAFGAGFSLVLPAVIGGLGLANIIKSSADGEFDHAGQELGGALAGGLAGFMVGGPLGAIVGAGLGSFGADFIRKAHLFGTAKEPTRYQRELGASHRHVGDTHEAEQKGFAKAIHFEKALEGMKHKQVRASRTLTRAEKDLKQVRSGRGQTDNDVIRAELRVWKAKARVNAKIEEQHRLEKKHGFALIGAKHKAVEAVAASKVEISSLKAYETHLLKVLKKEQEQGAFKGKLSEQTEQHIQSLESVEKRFGQAKSRELKAVEEAEKNVGVKFAKGLVNMTIAQAKFGKHYRGLKRSIETNPIKMHEIETQHALNAWTTKFQLPFQKKSHEAAKNSAQSFLNWEKTTTGAMGSVGSEMNRMLSTMGAKPLAFGSTSGKHKQTQKKARGGEIAIGAASGDSVHALLEKGEYVVNREAVSKVGVHKLNELNFGKAPRFQEGGAVGNLGAAIAEANRVNEAQFPYVWGGGHGGFNGPFDCSGAVSDVLHAAGLLGRPMVSGELASYGAPGAGPITIYANPEHTFMKIMGRFFGTSASNPGGGAGWMSDPGASYRAGFAVRHPTGVAAETLAKHMLTGPEGKLKQIGQRSVEHVESAAQKYLQKHMPGSFGGGDANVEGFGPGRIVGASTYGGPADHVSGTVGAAGVPLLGRMAFAELGMGSALGGLPMHAKLAISRGGKSVIGEKLDIGLGGGDVQGHSRDIDLYYDTARALGVAGPSEGNAWLGLVKVAEANAKKATGGLVTGSPAEMLLKAGGSTDSKEPKDKSSIEKSIKSTIHGLEAGKHLPKFQANLKKIARRISKIDLPHSQMERLGGFTNEAEKFAEYASNASSLTKSDEEGNITQGIFKGGTEGRWLEGELTSLVNLRKQIIGSHEVMAKKTLPQVMKLLKHTQKRLRESQKAIRDDENKKRELKKKIQDLEKVHNDNVRKLEKEKKELEDKLGNLQSAKTPNKAAIEQVRSEIKSKNEAIGSDSKEATAAIKKDQEKIRDVESDVHDKQRVEGAAKTLIGNLSDKRTSLYGTMSGLYGQGGEFEGTGLSFYGLEQVQGKGGTTGDIPNPPELGSVGGEIFSVQNRLREIQEELAHKPVASADESELKDVEKEIELEWKKRYMVSQAQFAVLSDFPSVGSIASVPKAGSYAIGGMVAATVGERGKEVAVMPTGSRVVPEHDAKDAIARMGGNGNIKFEHFEFHEADHRVRGRVNGQEFDEEVEKVTRKQSRRSMTPTPGGRGKVNRPR